MSLWSKVQKDLIKKIEAEQAAKAKEEQAAKAKEEQDIAEYWQRQDVIDFWQPFIDANPELYGTDQTATPTPTPAPTPAPAPTPVTDPVEQDPPYTEKPILDRPGDAGPVQEETVGADLVEDYQKSEVEEALSNYEYGDNFDKLGEDYNEMVFHAGIYDQSRADLAPYKGQGEAALSAIVDNINRQPTLPTYVSPSEYGVAAPDYSALPAPEYSAPNAMDYSNLIDPEYTAPNAMDLDQFGNPVFEFELDPNNEIYKWKQGKIEEAVNRAYAARGLHDSRPAVNSLSDANMGLMADEMESQYGRALAKHSADVGTYGRDYGRETDKFNSANLLAQQQYGADVDSYNRGYGQETDKFNAANMLTQQQYGADIDAYNRAYGETESKYNNDLNAMNTLYDRRNLNKDKSFQNAFSVDAQEYNKLADLTKLGLGAAGNTGNLTTNFGNQLSSTYQPQTYGGGGGGGGGGNSFLPAAAGLVGTYFGGPVLGAAASSFTNYLGI